MIEANERYKEFVKYMRGEYTCLLLFSKKSIQASFPLYGLHVYI